MASHYSPERRTVLVLSGTGVDGAYHAGVLRALQETGIKIDIVGGRGMGALSAVLFAIDGASTLWEPAGLWRTADSRLALYRWRWPLRWLGALALVLLAVLVLPFAVLLLISAVYPLALGLGMMGLETGASLATALLALVGAAFGPGALPTWIPRAVVLVVSAWLVVLVAGVLLEWWREPVRRTAVASPLWGLIGTPLDSSGAHRAALGALWGILRGGAAIKLPDSGDLSRRYADLLAENLGHPGFRELLLVVHDLDAQRDQVFGLLRDPYRKALFAASTATSARRAEAQDLSGVAREHVAEALLGALTLPAVSTPSLIRYAADAFWRGEAHRLSDRPSSLGRVIEEAAAAGAEQLIVVSASPEPPAPHELRPARRDGMGRVGEQLSSAEAAALADALRHLQYRFHGVYVIRPEHNPLRPLDLKGAYDERSDRHHPVDELLERGYEDAYRQFIEPVLGASGENL